MCSQHILLNMFANYGAYCCVRGVVDIESLGTLGQYTVRGPAELMCSLSRGPARGPVPMTGVRRLSLANGSAAGAQNTMNHSVSFCILTLSPAESTPGRFALRPQTINTYARSKITMSKRPAPGVLEELSPGPPKRVKTEGGLPVPSSHLSARSVCLSVSREHSARGGSGRVETRHTLRSALTISDGIFEGRPLIGSAGKLPCYRTALDVPGPAGQAAHHYQGRKNFRSTEIRAPQRRTDDGLLRRGRALYQTELAAVTFN